MSWLHVVILAVIQGAAELLPVSSSAHVILAERLLGLDPAAPELTFLLVMLHTGTMFAVIQFFWPRWRKLWSQPDAAVSRGTYAKLLVLATGLTGVLGFGLKKAIEKLVLTGDKAEIEELFRYLPLMAGSLLVVGLVILAAGLRESARNTALLDTKRASAIGVVQALCLPFRGFSRSGATISTGLFLGLPRETAEEFSFALAVLLTPAVVGWETLRLVKAHAKIDLALVAPGLAGMLLAFLSGALALRLLSQALEKGRFKFFGVYCVVFSAVVLAAHFRLAR